METLIKASQLLLSLSFLIVLHELGHFIPAKLFKVKVEKFYLFFEYKFSLFKKKIGDTVYGIGWIPLGGYVKIAGMIDESMDTDQMKKPPQPWEFRSKPAWQRLIIMLGGVTVNFILGWAIYIGITVYWGEDVVKVNDVKNGFTVTQTFKELGFQSGDKILKVNGETPRNVLDINKHLFLRDISSITVKHLNGEKKQITIPSDIGSKIWESGEMHTFKPRMIPSVLGKIKENSLANKAGILKGDKIIIINGVQTEYWSELVNEIKNAPEDLDLILLRNGQEEKVFINFKNVKEKIIGISPKRPKKNNAVKITHQDFSLGESISVANSKAYWTLRDYISQFKYVFTKKGASSIGGFISIGKIFPAKWEWESFWNITAFLSIMLGFMNLLPIPALDGGHVMFTLWEMITGKKPSDKFLEYAQVFGFVLLISLLLYANGNDIFKAIFN